MTKEQLMALGLADEQVEKILELKGLAIKPFTDENTKLKETQNALQTQIEQLTAAVTAANADVEKFKELDFEGMKAQAEQWKKKAAEAETQAATRIHELEFDGTLHEALSAEKFSSAFAKQGVIAAIKARNLPLEKGAIIGLTDVLTAIKTDNADAFISENLAGDKGGNGTQSQYNNQNLPPMYGGAGQQSFQQPISGVKIPFSFQTVRPMPDARNAEK